ncbi:hypothetical protein PR003_g12352 [Phytophthora rubi]|uniref:Uncharacterized protein n=1 Tax=Phytophthora rubi TaxID=129364 RepID=A0A6A3M6E5_9STRA|nr:hypothetical protein PR001_g11947 [Phytophthora rubi]KAE9336743.1 hypothetical protein PR003_g12352 [Phytophthora rubi]
MTGSQRERTRRYDPERRRVRRALLSESERNSVRDQNRIQKWIQEQPDLSRNDGKCRKLTVSDKNNAESMRLQKSGLSDKSASAFNRKNDAVTEPKKKLQPREYPVVRI